MNASSLAERGRSTRMPNLSQPTTSCSMTLLACRPWRLASVCRLHAAVA